MENLNGGKFPLITMEQLIKDRKVKKVTTFTVGQYLDREIKDIEGYWFELDGHFHIYNPYDWMYYCAEDSDELVEFLVHIKTQYKDFQKEEIDRYRMEQETNDLINDSFEDS